MNDLIQQNPIAWLIEGPTTDAEGWLTQEVVLSEPTDSLHPEAFVTPLHAGRVRFAGKIQAAAA